MAKPLVAAKVKMEVQATLGSPVTVSAITAAKPPVATATAHGFSNGDIVVFAITAGMPQMDRQAVRVANKSTDTFECENIDGTTFDAFTSGTVTKVSTFQTYDKSVEVTMPSPAAKRLDTTTLLDEQDQIEYGRPGAVDGKITALFNPAGAVEDYLAVASRTGADVAFRITWRDGRKTIWNGPIATAPGFDAKSGDVVKASEVAVTPKGAVGMVHFSS